MSGSVRSGVAGYRTRVLETSARSSFTCVVGLRLPTALQVLDEMACCLDNLLCPRCAGCEATVWLV